MLESEGTGSLIGYSGWNYGDTPDKGGWTDVFYPDKTALILFSIL